MQLYNNSFKLDLIMRFSLRSPELVKIVGMVVKYHIWFNVSSNFLKDNVVLGFLDEDIQKYAWIDAMMFQILLQKRYYIY